MATLAFRNVAQAALFELELKGQLSDGHWENSRPTDHWRAWCEATVVVDPTNVGRDFDVKRDSYAFASKDMLAVIGDRMMRYVRIAIAMGLDWAKKLDPLTDLDGRVVVPDSKLTGEYWDQKRAAISVLNVGSIAIITEDEHIFSRKQLVRELHDMKEIIKIWRKP